MENLKNKLSKIKDTSTDVNDIKLISLKKLINSYKKNNFKNYRRLKYLMYYYPNAVETSTIEEIELTMKYPNEVFMTLEPNDIRYAAFDKIFEEKYHGNLETFKYGRYIKVNDLFEHFGI
jgi:hypothetical protein